MAALPDVPRESDFYSVEPDGRKTDQWIFDELLGDDDFEEGEYRHVLGAAEPPPTVSVRGRELSRCRDTRAFLLYANQPRDAQGQFASDGGATEVTGRSQIASRMVEGLDPAENYHDTGFILPDGTRLSRLPKAGMTRRDTHDEAATAVGVKLYEAMAEGIVRYSPGHGAEVGGRITDAQAQHIVDASIFSRGNQPFYVDVFHEHGKRRDAKEFDIDRDTASTVRAWVNGHFDHKLSYGEMVELLLAGTTEGALLGWETRRGGAGGGGDDGHERTAQTAQSDAGTGSGGGSAVSAATDTARRAAQGRPDANSEAHAVANTYNETRGLPPVTHGYVAVDDARAGAIADAYDAMPDDDRDNPQVRDAYAALAREVSDQWDHVVASGMRFTPWTQPGQPYKDSKEMAADVKQHKHMYFFTGGEPHPLLGAHDPVTGLSINDKFRAIHDYFGHAAGGYGFGPRGEENAWLSHSQMLTPAARRALTTETRGQNSWVNFGAQNYHPDGTPKHIPPAERPFARQKVALLPDEYVLMPGETALGRTSLSYRAKLLLYGTTPGALLGWETRKLGKAPDSGSGGGPLRVADRPGARFGGRAADPQNIAGQLLDRATGLDRQEDPRWQPIRVTERPDETKLLLPDGTRLASRSGHASHGELIHHALGQGHTVGDVLATGVVRYVAGDHGGVEIKAPLTEHQAAVIADDWNEFYGAHHVTVDMSPEDNYNVWETGEFSMPVTADRLRHWSEGAHKKLNRSQTKLTADEAEALALHGTSEGAVKGWVTRREGQVDAPAGATGKKYREYAKLGTLKPGALKDAPSKYFYIHEDTKTVPVSKVRVGKAPSSKDVARYEQYAKEAAAGGIRRNPVEVARQPDGTFHVIDDHVKPVLVIARKHGWRNVPVRITSERKWKREHRVMEQLSSLLAGRQLQVIKGTHDPS
jgi:hypothetical protein